MCAHQNGSIKSDNVKATYDGSEWTTSEVVNYSPSYQYYAYYPYTANGLSHLGTSSAKGSIMANEISAASGTQAANGARAANATRAVSANTSASDFFASGISAFTPATNQSTAANFNASDLQVAKAAISRTTADDISFDLSHAMGLAEITIPTTTKSVPTEIVYNGNDGSVTSQNTTAVTISISKSFSGNTPYNTGKNDIHAAIVRPAVNTLLTTTASRGTLSWSHTFNVAANSCSGYALSADMVANRPAYTVVWNYGYIGSVKELAAPSFGTYKLEVWGARGACSGSRTERVGRAGLGGYATGTISVKANTNLYMCVGGSAANHGYNGGCDSTYLIGGGGGCTHIALTNHGVLSNYENFKEDVLIVAGGGGGVDVNTADAGDGGGESGGNGDPKVSGGTQTNGGQGVSPGSFGKGGVDLQYNEDYNANDAGGCGGGGWYGGGASKYTVGSGGGGSGHINTTYITNGSMTSGVRYGDGYARITLIP